MIKSPASICLFCTITAPSHNTKNKPPNNTTIINVANNARHLANINEVATDFWLALPYLPTSNHSFVNAFTALIACIVSFKMILVSAICVWRSLAILRIKRPNNIAPTTINGKVHNMMSASFQVVNDNIKIPETRIITCRMNSASVTEKVLYNLSTSEFKRLTNSPTRLFSKKVIGKETNFWYKAKRTSAMPFSLTLANKVTRKYEMKPCTINTIAIIQPTSPNVIA